MSPLFELAEAITPGQFDVQWNIPGAKHCKVRMMVAPLLKKIEGVAKVMPCTENPLATTFTVVVEPGFDSPDLIDDIFRAFLDEFNLEQTRNPGWYSDLLPYVPKQSPMAVNSDVGALSRR